MIKKADIILAVALVLLSAVFITATAFASEGKTVVIKVNNEIVVEMPIDNDAVKQIENDYGKNTVVIESGKVRVEDADCPDGYCEKHVAISDVGETIACLPHRLVVEIRE